MSLSLCLAALAGCAKDNVQVVDENPITRAGYPVDDFFAVGYWGDYYASGTHNFEVVFQGLTDGPNGLNGVEIGLDWIFENVQMDAEMLDDELDCLTLPVGMFAINGTMLGNSIVDGANTGSTYALTVEDGMVTSVFYPTGGYVIVQYDAVTGLYRVDITLQNTTGVFQAEYYDMELCLQNPNYIDPVYYDRLLCYDAAGTPAFWGTGVPTWSGEIVYLGGAANLYGVTNGFDIDAIIPGFMHAIDADRYANMSFNTDIVLGSGTVTDPSTGDPVPVEIYGLAAFYAPGTTDLYTLNMGGYIPLAWDPINLVITFPEEMEIDSFGDVVMMYGIGARDANGDVWSIVSDDLYEYLDYTLYECVPTAQAASTPKSASLYDSSLRAAKGKAKTVSVPASSVQKANITVKQANNYTYSGIFR